MNDPAIIIDGKPEEEPSLCIDADNKLVIKTWNKNTGTLTIYPLVVKDGGVYMHGREEPNLTNADRIRSMTDEELAEWICEVQDGESLQRENYLPSLSKGFWIKWLKQEVTD